MKTFITKASQIVNMSVFEKIRFFDLPVDKPEVWKETLTVNLQGLEFDITPSVIDQMLENLTYVIGGLKTNMPEDFKKLVKTSCISYKDEPYVKMVNGPYAFDYLDNPDLSQFTARDPISRKVVRCDWSNLELEAKYIDKMNENKTSGQTFLEIASKNFRFGVVKIIPPRIYFDYVLKAGSFPNSPAIRE